MEAADEEAPPSSGGLGLMGVEQDDMGALPPAAAVVEAEVAVEAAALELEQRLALLRQYSNWRLNTRQYPSSPNLEQAYASWALRQTASGGLSLVLPPAAEEEHEGEQHEHGHGAEHEAEFYEAEEGVYMDEEEHEHEEKEQQQQREAEPTPTPAPATEQQPEEVVEGGPAPPLGDDYYPRRGQSLASAIDDIQTYMSRRASRAWSRSASLAAAAAAAASATGSGRASPGPLPLDKRAIGAGAVPVPPGVEGGGATAAAAAAAATRERDSSVALRASLLAAAAAGRVGPSSKAAMARQRRLWALGDYGLSLLVFVMLSVTWWRGAWNLYNLYVFPYDRTRRVLTLVGCGSAVNVLVFLAYGPLRAWGRRIKSPGESWVYGAMKRLAVLVRMLASCAAWTGWWDLGNMAFCPEEQDMDDATCEFRPRALWAITGAGLIGLIAIRQLNTAVWCPLFAVSLDFQCELVLDTSLRFGTDRQPVKDARSLARRVGDILATQTVPDVFSVMAWYGLYTWLPLAFTGTSVAAELTYVAGGLALALLAFAMQFILGGLVERYYPSPTTTTTSSSSSSRRPSGPMPPRSVRSARGLQQQQEKAVPGLGLGKYLAEILLYLVAFVAANVVWVFAWAFLDDHLLTWSYELSNWSCVLVALPLEFALNFASTEVAGGVYLDGTGEGASGFYFPICYCGEVSAYQAALRSASTYALYRKSTLARLRGLSASLSSLGLSRSIGNFSVSHSQATLGRSRPQGHGHGHGHGHHRPGSSSNSGSRRGSRAGVGASLGASGVGSSSHSHSHNQSRSGSPPRRPQPSQQRNDLGLGLGLSASGSSGSSGSGAEPQAALLRHHSSLSPDSPIRMPPAGALAAVQREHSEGSMSMDGTTGSGVALLSDEQRARRSDSGQAIAAGGAAGVATGLR